MLVEFERPCADCGRCALTVKAIYSGMKIPHRPTERILDRLSTRHAARTIALVFQPQHRMARSTRLGV